MATRNIADAHPQLQAKFLAALEKFRSAKWRRNRFDIKISCVLRSDDEQKALFWKSRIEIDGKILKKPGTRHVTYCDGVRKKSRHQANMKGQSEAIDFFVVRKKTGKADWLCKVPYCIFGYFCSKEGLEYGGHWVFKDRCHVQLPAK